MDGHEDREPLTVDGAQGEGGGQVLRSSLALSLVTGRPFHIHRIRARRRKPGLLRQHLTAVRAAAEVSGATVEGDALRSPELRFAPGPVRAGDYGFAVGSAGSTMLVLQTVLWPLLLAPGRSRLTLEGGTHNPMAPPFDFVERCLLPLLHAMGAHVQVELRRAGFYPAGGGELVVEIDGGHPLRPLERLQRGAIAETFARAQVSSLPVSIARRELEVVHARLGWSRQWLKTERVSSLGPGNVLMLELRHDGGTTLVTGFGEKGVSAEEVAVRTVEEAERFIAAGVPVCEHLADQLLVPLALAGGGSFRTMEPSLHTRTNAELVQRWLPVSITLHDEGGGAWRVDVGPR
ncbi:RNA 3'-terminal phosphate cyclase [Paraliomyxa miuraensis]|uniref:RNA 3'-terminal phosphate cyclase n=1 Tax=Paraliomyxa miuraensis TaxID=376150 RepID=UPI00224F8909|nr:RNA 3'-terminal phosphate cyclase [Paraliomyxa miuraensis]MCX4241878.1 RNA 3'-terminal phosphate cyclase [Paraliomyxa miuraensis]